MEKNPNNYFKFEARSVKKDKIEGRVFSFDDPEQHKSTRLKINKVNRILGSGSYSKWVAEVNVSLENDTSIPQKTHNMVIKRYRTERMDGEQNLKESYENYKALKKAGIPTWDTYRINQEYNLALMTLGIKENETLLTANDDYDDHPEIERLRQNPVKEITNLDEFVAKIILILGKLNLNGYRLRPDSWGVVFKPQQNNPGVYEIDVIISDIDSLDRSDEDYYISNYVDEIKERFEKENKSNLSTALHCIFPGNRVQKIEFDKSVMAKI